MEELFAMFDAFLGERGFRATGGQIIDASIVPVPIQRNSREENADIKAGDIPAGWVEGSANRLAQKDLDARWTTRNGVSRYGYKSHVSTDRRHKLVRRYAVTDAATHDSRVIEQVLDPDNTAATVWADTERAGADHMDDLTELRRIAAGSRHGD